ncbi:MAG: restriction endonuclease subunit S [Planctomycetia bacterium]
MKVVSVGDISEQVRGVSYSKSESSEEPRPGYVAVLRANNITDEGLSFADLVYVPVARVSAKQRLHAHDVVIAASSGSLSVVGKAAQARQAVDGSFGAFCKVLRPTDEVDPLYFGHFFRTPDYRRTVSGLAAGANINNLKNEHLDNLQIPLPLLREQKRIAAILDAADALRAKRRESIEQLDSLVQATFLEMFGDPATNPKAWELRTLSEVTSKITDGEHLNPKFSDAGMPMVMAGNVHEDGVVVDSAKCVERTLGERFRRKCDPEVNDILLVSRGATIGRSCLVTFTAPFCLMGSVILLKPLRGGVHPSFLCHFLRQSAIRTALHKTSGSSAQQAIYIKDVRKLVCVIPPLDLQSRFASIVESIEHQKTRLKSHLAELDALFSSLQSRAFNGELVA